MPVPDYTSPVIILGLLVICVYAYIGGRWLDRRYKKYRDKMEELNLKKRMDDFK
tara:strand:- start:871 stop:1032 length:162 start_codon:yes stop_codon:yes gene_type:complete